MRQVTLGDEWETQLAAQPHSWIEPPDVDERAVAEIFYTSGSTGKPKGAMLTHRGLYLHAVHSALTLNISGHDVVLHTIPLFHVNGWGTPHYVTGLGGVHVMLPRFDSAEVLRLVEAERVTRLYLVPAMMTALLNDPTFDEPRPDERAAAVRRRRADTARAPRRGRAPIRVRVHLRLRDDRERSADDEGDRQARRAPISPPPQHDRDADPRRRPAHLRR